MKQVDDYIGYKNDDEQEKCIAYPLADDGDIYQSYDQMLKEMMTRLHPDVNYEKWLERISLAITLNDPHHYEMFLDQEWETFKNCYFKEYHLEDHVIAKHSIDALYIGNAYCFLLFPDIDQLCQIIKKSARSQSCGIDNAAAIKAALSQ